MLLQQVVVGSTAGILMRLKLEQISYCFQLSRCKLNLFGRSVWGFCGAAAQGSVGLFCLFVQRGWDGELVPAAWGSIAGSVCPTAAPGRLGGQQQKVM